MSINFDSDQSILDHTVRQGDTLSIPDMDFVVQLPAGQKMDMTMASSWCGMVRGENERKEEQRNTSRRQERALKDAADAGTAAAGDTGGGGKPADAHIQANEATVSEFIAARIELLEAQSYEYLVLAEEASANVVRTTQELTKLYAMKEVLDGSGSPREDGRELGGKSAGDQGKARRANRSKVVQDVPQSGG